MDQTLTREVVYEGSSDPIIPGKEQFYHYRCKKKLSNPKIPVQVKYLDIPASEITDSLKKRIENATKSQKNISLEKILLQGLNTLYGTGESIFDDKDKSYPLPEVSAGIISVAVYAMNNEKSTLISTLIKEGKPKLLPVVYRYTDLKENAADQYARNPALEDIASSEEDTRRVFVVGEQQAKVFLESCYVLAELEKKVPGAFKAGLKYFAHHNKVSIGMLQTLHTLDVMEDERYSEFALMLRDIVMDEIPTYEELKKRYSYTVFDKAEFWIDGEIKRQMLEKKRHGVEFDENATDVERDDLGVDLPRIGPWNARVSKIQQDLEIIKQSTTSIVIHEAVEEGIRSQGNRSEPRLRRQVRKRLSEKAALSLEISQEKRRLYSKYVHEYVQSLSMLGEVSELNDEIFKNVIQSLSSSAVGINELSMKSQKWLEKYSRSNNEYDVGEYPLDYEKLGQKPLFDWMGVLQNPEARNRFLATIKSSPKETTLLYRMMLTSFLHESILVDEEEYLFSSSDAFSNSDIERAQQFFEQLTHVFEGVDMTQDEALKSILPVMHEQTNDLTQYYRLEAIKKWTKKWVSRPFIGPLRVANSNGIPQEALKFFGKIGLGITVVGSVGDVAIDYLLEQSEYRTVVNEIAVNELWQSRQTPDSLSRRDLERREPFVFANVLHLPDSFASEPSSANLFFPVTFTESAPGNKRLPEFELGVLPLEEYNWENHQLVYQPEVITETLSPPIGYEFTKVIADSGGQPTVNDIGALTWSAESILPSNIILVAEPVTISARLQNISSRLTLYDGIRSEAYDLLDNFDYEQALALNTKLSGDPELQNLHLAMIDELHHMQAQGIHDVERQTDFVIKYAVQYLIYVEDNRYYSLNLNTIPSSSEEVGMSFLEKIATNPDQGYYCAIAAESMRDFFTSAGVRIEFVSGFPTKIGNSDLWTRDGHAVNLIHMNDGTQMYIDTTPNVVDGKTPTADLDALFWSIPELDEDSSLKVDDVLKMSLSSGIAVSAAAATFAGLIESHRRLKKRKIQKKFESVVNMGKEKLEFDDQEFKMMGAAVAYIGLLGMNSPETYAEHAAYMLSLIEHTDKKGYGGLIQWIAEEYVPNHSYTSTIEDIHKSIPSYRDSLYQVIREGWYSNKDGIRDLIPENQHAIIEERFTTGGDLYGLDPSLDAAIELGIVMHSVDMLGLVHRVKRNLANFDEKAQIDLKEELLQREKVHLTRQLIARSFNAVNKKSRNAAYLQYLFRVFSET